MSAPEEPERYYESDSPCRRCGGTTRYRAPEERRGQCVGCVQAAEEEAYVRRYILAGPRS